MALSFPREGGGLRDPPPPPSGPPNPHTTVNNGEQLTHLRPENHLKERLLDQAQARASRLITQGMTFDVQPLVKSLFCPTKQSPNGFFVLEASKPLKMDTIFREGVVGGVKSLWLEGFEPGSSIKKGLRADRLRRRSADPLARTPTAARRFVCLVFDHATTECSCTLWVPQCW